MKCQFPKVAVLIANVEYKYLENIYKNNGPDTTEEMHLSSDNIDLLMKFNVFLLFGLQFYKWKF